MSSIEKVKNAVATTTVTNVWEYFERRKADIAKVLPSHITIDRLIGVMSYAIKSNPEIMQASQASLISAVIQTVQLGLEPGNLGHCYYVPFNNKKKDGSIIKEIQFILGVRGIIELVNRARMAVILSTECVYEGDKFEYAQGLNPVLVHIPSTERGELLGTYAIAKNLIAQEKLFIYMTKDEIDKVRKSARGADSPYSPWNKWYEEMAKKTVVKRLSKLLPLSVEVQKLVRTDETTKSRIDKDMTIVPDETNWADGIVDVSAIEQHKEAANSPVEAQTQAQPPVDTKQKIEPQKGDFVPSSSDLKTVPEMQLREEIGEMIGRLSNGNDAVAPEMLKNFTKFKDFSGYSNLMDIKATSRTGGRTQLEVTHSKVKKEYLATFESDSIDVEAEQ